MTQAVHPRDALFGGEKPFPVIPTCEHFAGSEKLITKALEFQDKLGACRFRDCSHVHEPGCAVKDAVDAGEIHPRRYASYVRLRQSP